MDRTQFDASKPEDWQTNRETMRKHVVLRRLMLNVFAAMTDEQFRMPAKDGRTWASHASEMLRLDARLLQVIETGRGEFPPQDLALEFPSVGDMLAFAKDVDVRRTKLLLNITKDEFLKTIRITTKGENVDDPVGAAVTVMLDSAAAKGDLLGDRLRTTDYPQAVGRRIHEILLFVAGVDVARIAAEQGLPFKEPQFMEDTDFVQLVRRKCAGDEQRRRLLLEMIQRVNRKQFVEFNPPMKDSLALGVDWLLAIESWYLDILQQRPCPTLESRYLKNRPALLERWAENEARKREVANSLRVENYKLDTGRYSDPFQNVSVLRWQILDRMTSPNQFELATVARSLARLGMKREILQLFGSGDDSAATDN